MLLKSCNKPKSSKSKMLSNQNVDYFIGREISNDGFPKLLKICGSVPVMFPCNNKQSLKNNLHRPM